MAIINIFTDDGGLSPTALKKYQSKSSRRKALAVGWCTRTSELLVPEMLIFCFQFLASEAPESATTRGMHNGIKVVVVENVVADNLVSAVVVDAVPGADSKNRAVVVVVVVVVAEAHVV